jgi:hypothetical protein
MNKMIDGKQCTIAWHVDDLKISHVSVSVVEDIIEFLQGEFGKEAPMSVSRGDKHDYLGMVLDYSVPGEVQVDMIDYINGVLDEMPIEMVGRAQTPAGNHLFTINEDAQGLSEEKATTFHRMVMQLQYLSQRARPDIRTAVSFLCKRTTKADVDDWKKLVRVMKYLQATLDLKLRLSADGSGCIHWWVDASFAVHLDMKGHTGGTMSLGKGSIYSTAGAQKLVSRSSTESELIGAHDVLPQLLWTTRFLAAQGHSIAKTVLYQDNTSAMLLESNGRASSTKRTRHIQLRYFFIKDCIQRGEVQVEHCPTEDMIADFFTKPLNGKLFYKLRNLIMNIDCNSKYYSSPRSVLSDGLRSDEGSRIDAPSTTNSYKNALLRQPLKLRSSGPHISGSLQPCRKL